MEPGLRGNEQDANQSVRSSTGARMEPGLRGNEQDANQSVRSSTGARMEPGLRGNEQDANQSVRSSTGARMARRGRAPARRTCGERGASRRAISWSRLATVLVAAVLVWLSVQAKLFPLVWAAGPTLLFLVLLVLHERVLQQANRLERAQAFYRQMLDRLGGDWRAGGRPGSRFADEHADHVYAADLDLFGPDSLFKLLSRGAHPRRRRTPGVVAAPARAARCRARPAGGRARTGAPSRLPRASRRVWPSRAHGHRS